MVNPIPEAMATADSVARCYLGLIGIQLGVSFACNGQPLARSSSEAWRVELHTEARGGCEAQGEGHPLPDRAEDPEPVAAQRARGVHSNLAETLTRATRAVPDTRRHGWPPPGS